MTAEKPITDLSAAGAGRVIPVATSLSTQGRVATDIDSPVSTADPIRSVQRGCRFTDSEWTLANSIIKSYGHSNLAAFVRALFFVLGNGGRIIGADDAAILDHAKSQLMGNAPKN